MSLAHIRFIQETNDGGNSQYRVESSDMGITSDWVEIGRLHLRKNIKEYDFIPGIIWLEKRALPPSFYGLAEHVQKQKIISDYKGFAWGTWAMIVHHYAINLLENQNFPIHYPESMF